MMNNSQLLLSFCLIILSCKERINLNGDFREKLVIEAEIVKGEGPHFVKISKTTSFSGSKNYIPQLAQNIVITDDAGNIDTLKMYGGRNGIYVTSKIIGTPGKTYYLKVNYNGEIYSAKSIMPYGIELDTVFSEFIIRPSDRIVIGRARSKGVVPEYYRFHVKNIASLVSTHYVYENVIAGSHLLNFIADKELHSVNDSIEFVLFNIDKQNYDYFKALNMNQTTESSSINGNIVLTNPRTNISGPKDVLGYFSAHTRSSIRVKL